MCCEAEFVVELLVIVPVFRLSPLLLQFQPVLLAMVDGKILVNRTVCTVQSTRNPPGRMELVGERAAYQMEASPVARAGSFACDKEFKVGRGHLDLGKDLVNELTGAKVCVGACYFLANTLQIRSTHTYGLVVTPPIPGEDIPFFVEKRP